MYFSRFFKLLILFMASGLSLWGAAKADLGIVKSSPLSIVDQNSSMSYTLEITNYSISTNAQDINVTDILPAGMQYQSASGTGWSCSGAGSPVTVTCLMDELAKSTSSTITLNVISPTSSVPGTITFTNNVSISTVITEDDNPANDTSALTTTLNRPPTAVNDIVSTTSHTAVSGNVLTNDSDLDGDALSVTNTGIHTLTFGAITINPDGSFTYTPGYFTGETDHFTYTVSDANGATSTATLQINIASACSSVGVINAERNFCLRKQTVLFGDMITAGNTILVPPTTQNSTVCSTYTTGAYYTDSPSGEENNELYLCSYKPDSYLNATSAEVVIPSGGEVKWAGLYIQSLIRQSDAGTLSSMDIKIKNGSDSYASTGAPTVVNHAQYFYANSRYYNGYSAFIDVTNILKENNWNGGTYTVANVPVTSDNFVGSFVQGKYGAWTLVVMYENPNETLKSFSVYDGWQQITGSSTTVDVDNFYTPTTGAINSKVSVFAAEGDKYRTGDYFQGYNNNTGTWDNLGTTPNNAFDSGIISSGSRTPSLNNNQGIDIKTYEVGTSGYNLLSNGQSSTSFRFPSSMDYYMPSMLSFSTEVYNPRMCYYEDIYDLSGNNIAGTLVARGSSINVKVLLKNDNPETAENVMLYKVFDNTMPYIAASTEVNNAGNPDINASTTPVTDALDSDIFDYSSPLDLFSLHVGTGATYNQGGDFVTNQTALFKYTTKADFDGSTSISYNIAYTMPSIGYKYEGELVKCEDFNNTFGTIPQSVVVGNMNVIENASYTNAGSYAAANKNLFTKIVKKPFSLEAVYLDENGDEVIYNGNIGNKEVNMAVMLYTADDTCTYNPLIDKLIWRGQIVHNTSHATALMDDIDLDTADEEEGFTLDRALTSRRIKAEFIDYGTLINNTSDLVCATSSLDSSLCLVPACMNSDTQILSVFPLDQYPYVATCLYGDGGGAAPCDSDAYNGSCGGKKTTISPSKYNNDIGCAMCLADALNMNGCSSDDFAIRPDDFAINQPAAATLVAGTNFNLEVVAKGFNNTAVIGNYNGVASVSPLTQIPTCSVPDGNLTNDSNTSVVAIAFNGVDTSLNNNLKFGDIGIFDINITDSTWSAVDSIKNDCLLGDNTNVTDTNGQIGCNTQNIFTKKVIPDHFDVNGTLSNGSNGFTYLLNFDTNATLDPGRLSALLNSSVTAKSALNNTTQNYSNGCYANNGNATLNITLAPSPSAADLSALLWYDDVNSSIIGSLAIDGSGVYSLNINNYPAQRFSTGVGNLRYRLNFNRTVINPVNPFLMSITNEGVTDTDGVSGNGAIDNNATFIYGRTHATRQRYTGNSGTANIYFEGYCYGTTCNKNLLPNGLTSINTDDIRWFRNLNHVSPTDGAVGIVVQKGGSNVAGDIVDATDNPTGNPSVTTLGYDGSKGYPYKTTMQNEASHWLIYNENDPFATRNEFQVEFDTQGTWTGEKETTTTTKDVGGTTTNRRIMW